MGAFKNALWVCPHSCGGSLFSPERSRRPYHPPLATGWASGWRKVPQVASGRPSAAFYEPAGRWGISRWQPLPTLSLRRHPHVEISCVPLTSLCLSLHDSVVSQPFLAGVSIFCSLHALIKAHGQAFELSIVVRGIEEAQLLLVLGLMESLTLSVY